MKSKRLDKYDYLIAMATLDVKDDDVKMFEEQDDSDVVLSDRITKKIDKLISKESNYKTSRAIQFQKVLSKVAIIALVVVSVMFAAMMSVSAIRTAIWEIITEWYEEYIAIGYEPEEGYGVVEPPKMIEEIRKPTLLPLGAEEDILINKRNGFLCEYYVEDECCLTFNQLLLKADTNMYDSEGAAMTEIAIGNNKAWLITYEDKDYIYILWNDSEYSYQMSSLVLSAHELILIAESVK